LKDDGILVKTEDTVVNTDKKTINYSLKDREVEQLKKIIKIPGDHNILDALAALKVARILGVKDDISFSALSKYAGSWRRFEETQLPGFILIDDYGHHPTEILATLKGAREKYPDRKIFCVFQPHQYQRTYLLFNDFVKAFKEAIDSKLIDKLLLIDVYDVAGRESKEAKEKVSSKILAEAIGNAEYTSKEDLFEKLNGGEVVIFMGAGDIYNLSQDLKALNGFCS
jgi:UDP-N-acetylmuramate--alanine ligase